MEYHLFFVGRAFRGRLQSLYLTPQLSSEVVNLFPSRLRRVTAAAGRACAGYQRGLRPRLPEEGEALRFGKSRLENQKDAPPCASFFLFSASGESFSTTRRPAPWAA